MADLLQESKGYLEARLKECETNPALNANQIKAYQDHLAMAASSKDAAEYADKVAATGDMFAVSKAEQLDLYENRIRMRGLFGDERSAAAEKACLEAAKASTSHNDLYNKMNEASNAASAALGAARQAVEKVTDLVLAVVGYHTCCAKKKGEYKTKVKTAWEETKKLDPGFAWDRINAYKPYRSAVPLDAERLGKMKPWLEEALR